MIAEAPPLSAPAHAQERTCPRCGRPFQRRRQAKWCSDTCKARAYEKRRQERADLGKRKDTLRPIESKETVTVTGSRRLWERSSPETRTALDALQPILTDHSNGNGNGAGTNEATAAAVRQALSRRLHAGAEDAIFRRVRSLLTRKPR